MPKSSFCRDPDEEAREEVRKALFGMAQIAMLAEATGIDKTTLGRRKNDPDDLRLGEIRKICRAQGLKIVITKPDYILAGR